MNDSPKPQTPPTRLPRRQFITGLAIGAGLAPLATLSNRTNAGPAPAAGDLCTGRSVLTSADIRYLGGFRGPRLSQDPLQLSFGNMTGRSVNGDFRLLLSGYSGIWQDQASVVELRPPSTFTKDWVTIPEATMVQSWSDIWQGRPQLQVGSLRFRGMHYDPALDVLWWGYSSDYAGQPHNPSIGATRLNSDGSVSVFGPWRTTSHSAQTCGYMLSVPDWFRGAVGGARLAIGNPPHVNNARASFGANLQAFSPPALTQPPDPVNDAGVQSIATKPLVFYPMDHPQKRSATFKTCGWNSGYSNPGDNFVRQGLGQFGGDYPSALLDWMDSCAWIDLPGKHGLVFFGQLADTIAGRAYVGDTQAHNWYGANPCPHGQVARVYGATGPGAGSLVNQAWIFNPDDLLAVARGQKQSWEIQAASTFRASVLGGFVREERDVLYQFGGAYFDANTSRLYLAERNSLGSAHGNAPAVHVFEVA